MDRVFDLSETLIRCVYQLACTPFTMLEFRRRWEEFGWHPEPGGTEESGFCVSIPQGGQLLVARRGPGIRCANVPFCYWEDFDRDSHETEEEYARQRAAYDAEFDAAAELAQRLLPQPFLRWTDSDEDHHRALAWEGTHGVLVLQQACFDPQFGIEINFWLTSCSRADFSPKTPLIDWLIQQSQRMAH